MLGCESGFGPGFEGVVDGRGFELMVGEKGGGVGSAQAATAVDVVFLIGDKLGEARGESGVGDVERSGDAFGFVFGSGAGVEEAKVGMFDEGLVEVSEAEVRK